MATSDEINSTTLNTAFPDSDGYTTSFLLDEEAALFAFFQEHGFVVVRNLIDSQSQVEETIDEIWSLLRTMNPNIDKNDSSTWDEPYWPTQLGLKDGERKNCSVLRKC